MRPRSLRRLTTTATLLATGVVVVACGGGGGGDDRANVFPAQNCVFRYLGEPPPQFAGADPLRSRQWHLEDLQAITVWESLGIKGEGVRVAVVDDAVETLHEDLFPNIGAVHDYRPGSAPGSAPLPCESTDDHGTSVAGIVAARDGNGVGAAGVAPRATLAAYNALATSTNADIADALRREGNANAIYNNSWGSVDNGVLHEAESSFVAAIEDGIRNGRNGLGSVYVFPAGNGGLVEDNSNFDGYVNHRGVIAACPVDDAGLAPFYAERGANVLVCGPSGGGTAGITTTAVQNGYRHDFSGTSASTPMVSGVVALMLSANPSLTWRDVRIILARTARRNSPGDPGWQTNAAGLAVHPQFGFGVADADAAVRMAQGWSSVGGSEPEALKRCERSSSTATFPIRINDQGEGPAVSDVINVTDCAISQIEFVEVFFTATHTYSGDLRVELLRPDNPVSPVTVLANERLCSTDGDNFADDCGSYSDWRFGSVRNLDETAAGQWQLRVSDRFQDDEGVWNSWRLVLWGR